MPKFFYLILFAICSDAISAFILSRVAQKCVPSKSCVRMSDVDEAGKSLSALDFYKKSGLLGQHGELYFDPKKPVLLKDVGKVSKPQIIPVIPYSKVFVPMERDFLDVIDMRHRQLINDYKYFGLIYVSNMSQKVGLVGTLVKQTHRKLLDDGRAFVTVEGMERFALTKLVSEQPFLSAEVKFYDDYTFKSSDYLDRLELAVYREVRANMKFLQMLSPNKNYTISKNIWENRPRLLRRGGYRRVNLVDDHEFMRRKRFSYAVIYMIQAAEPLKLSLLQEPILEVRLMKILNILRDGRDVLTRDLISRGLISSDPAALQKINDEALKESSLDFHDELTSTSMNEWIPENYENGQWLQQPTFF